MSKENGIEESEENLRVIQCKILSVRNCVENKVTNLNKFLSCISAKDIIKINVDKDDYVWIFYRTDTLLYKTCPFCKGVINLEEKLYQCVDCGEQFTKEMKHIEKKSEVSEP